jgi:hypothetical protein
MLAASLEKTQQLIFDVTDHVLLLSSVACSVSVCS